MGKEQKPRTKVIIRKLPPHLPEASLWEVVQQFVPEKYGWCLFVAGKVNQKYVKFSRAYIDFNEPSTVFEFKEKFDGHVFVSDKGAQYRAVVEYAPFQNVPVEPSKKDPREGTIAKDSDYIEFCKQLDASNRGSSAVDAGISEKDSKTMPSSEPKVIVTPLMQAIMEKHSLHKRVVAVKPKGKEKAKTGPATVLEVTKGLKTKQKRQESVAASSKPVASISDKKTQGKQEAGSAPGVAVKGKRTDGKEEKLKENKKTKEPATKSHEGKEASKARKAKEPVKPKQAEHGATHQHIKAAAQEAKDAAAAAMASSSTGGAQQVGTQDDTKRQKPLKNVRVREGFELWMPKRVGRLTNDKDDDV